MKTLNFAKNILLSNLNKLENPYKLTYAITYKCNSRCLICNIWKKTNYKEMSDEEIALFFQKNTFFNWIDITGGEVFLRKNIVEIIKNILKTQKNLYLLHIPTNGIMTERTVGIIKQIINLKPKNLIITVSLDGPVDIHDKLRGIKGNWLRAIATYKKLKALESSNFQCYVGMTLSQYNFDLIEKTYKSIKKYISDFDRNKLHFNLAHSSSHYYGNREQKIILSQNIINNIDSYNKKKNKRFSPTLFLEQRYQSLIPDYLCRLKSPISCLAATSSIFIDPDGNIYPCAMWNKRLGNLRDFNYKLANFWRNKEIKRVRTIIKKLKCRNCWTPCEAYQSILGNLFNKKTWKK